MSTARRLALLGVAASALLFLAGCAGVFAPDPTTTRVPSSAAVATDVPCTTKNSTISDSDPSATGPAAIVVVMADVARFDSTGENVEQESRSIDASGIIELTPENAFDSLAGTQAEWRTAVLDAIHSLGTVPRNLGVVSGTIASTFSSPFAVSTARNAVWIRGYVARSHIVPFTVNCPDGFSVSGTVTTFDPNTASEVKFVCDSRKHPRDDAAEAALRAVCDESSVHRQP